MTTIRYSRVVVGFSSETGNVALNAAADIARSLSAELSGLFIEDEAVFGIADLPFSTEIAVAGGARPYSRRDAEEAFQTASAGMRRRLEAIARAAHLPYTFARERGEVRAILSHAAHASDIVMFVEPERAIESLCLVTSRFLEAALSSPGAVLYIPRRATDWHDGVAAVVDGAGDRTILGTALRIAAGHNTTLTVLDTGESDHTAAEIAAIARELGVSPPPVRFRRLSAGGIGALFGGPGAFDDHLLVMARATSMVSTPQALRALAGGRRAPVLLVAAGEEGA